MKTKKSIEKEVFRISEEELNAFSALMTDMERLIEKKTVSESTLTSLSNIITVLDTFREKFMWRLLRASKQDHMID